MGSKGWWNLVKNLVGNSENRCIPPIESEGRLVFDDTEKAELFNNFFCEQSNLDDSHHTPPPSVIFEMTSYLIFT